MGESASNGVCTMPPDGDGGPETETGPVLGDAAALREAATRVRTGTARTPVGTVGVRSMTAGQVLEMGEIANSKDPAVKRRLTALVFCWCAVDGEGRRMFTDEQAGEVEGFDFGLVNAVAEKAIELTGLDEKGLAEAQGNSATSRTAS